MKLNLDFIQINKWIDYIRVLSNIRQNFKRKKVTNYG